MVTFRPLELKEPSTEQDKPAGRVAMRPARFGMDDNGEILIREVLPLDRWRYTKGTERLSEKSRFLRFHSARFQFTESIVEYFTGVDQINHVAIGVADSTREELPGIGVARWVKCKNRCDCAEVAITVIDEFQGRGIGTLLFAGLCHYAQRSDINTFEFSMLAHRTTLVKRFLQLGARIRERGAGIVEMEMAVPGRPEDVPESAAGTHVRNALRLLTPSFA